MIRLCAIAGLWQISIFARSLRCGKSVLNLQDWTIALLQSHPSDLRRGTLGNIHWDVDKRTAVIRVLDASDYQRPFNAAVKDMEFTVVHELVHLELSSLTRNFKSRSEESYSGEEQAVNGIADALLHLDAPPSSARKK